MRNNKTLFKKFVVFLKHLIRFFWIYFIIKIKCKLKKHPVNYSQSVFLWRRANNYFDSITGKRMSHPCSICILLCPCQKEWICIYDNGELIYKGKCWIGNRMIDLEDAWGLFRKLNKFEDAKFLAITGKLK